MIRLPSNTDVRSRVQGSEESLLGALMRAGADRDLVFARLRPWDFSTDAHQTLARCIWDMAAEREPIELTTVYGRLTKTGAAANLSSASKPAAVWLSEVYEAACISSSIEHETAEVLDAARLRMLGQIGQRMAKEAESPSGPAAEVVSRAMADIAGLADRESAASSHLKTSAEAVNEAMDEIGRRQRGEAVAGISTGLKDIDVLIGGLAFGQLTILAARPSVGKTALALQLARYAAASGHRTLFASLEQASNELAIRSLAATARVCGKALGDGRGLPRPEWDRVIDAADAVRDLPLSFDDTPGQTTMHILATARRLKREGGLAFVIVDYLQLVQPGDTRANRNDQLDVITRHVRELARELNVAVLALSQLSRDCEKQNRRPRLSDLRDSGSLEQHADNVFFLHRQERSAGDSDLVEFGVDKQRNGPVGETKLMYQRRTLTFENAPPLLVGGM